MSLGLDISALQALVLPCLKNGQMFQPYLLSLQNMGRAEPACPKVLTWVIYNPVHFHKI